jgi:hypothetical protein
MSRTKKEIPSWAKSGHAKPVTRREFLAHGIIPFAAAAFMPNWMRLLAPQEVLAATCADSASGMIPFFQLNLEGGCALAANFIPMDAGRQPLATYDIIGAGKTPNLVRMFNNAPFLSGSGILRALQSTSDPAMQNSPTFDPATLNNTAMIGYCVQSRDDSRENALAANGLIEKAGAVGLKLPALGNKDTSSGINQTNELFVPASPLVVRNYNDMANSMGYTAGLATLSQAQKEKLTGLIGSLNESQTRKLASITSGDKLQNVVECVGIKNNQLIAEGAASIDPRNNAAVSSIWGLAANTNVGSENFVAAAMAYNTLMGNAGSSSFSKGGYDYHGNDRATVTDVKDFQTGMFIRKLLETAKVLNKKFYLMVTTDGAVSATRSDSAMTNFNSDRGSAGMIYTFLYDPAGRPSTTDFQVGNYTAGQSADSKFLIGGSPGLATQAVFLNYLKMNNRMDLYSKVITSTRGLDAAGIASVVKVG